MVRALFEQFPAHDLAGFIVWVPMLPEDDDGAAASQQAVITDPRFHFWFDADKAAANAWSSFIGYPGTTWDTYAFYDETAVWNGATPPAPRIWMHQLDETPATQNRDTLDVARLAREWLPMIGGSAADADAWRDACTRGEPPSPGVILPSDPTLVPLVPG